MKSITPSELKGWLENHKIFELLDVREDWEHEAYNIGGKNIPMNDVMSQKDVIDKNIPTVIYCEKGVRSAIIIQRLMAYGFDNIYNLEGGMSAWRKMK